MNNEDLVEQIRSQLKCAIKQSRAFEVLSDRQWHCREHELSPLGSRQAAGGGGIQGLERGNRSGRRGLVLEKKKDDCVVCKRKTEWDRWTGEIKEPNAPANIPRQLVDRILKYYSYIDVIEQRQRYADELVIDHRFPMERWGGIEPQHDIKISESEIQSKFQLLKKDSAGNHNLLKSRSCERCIKTGRRGTPMGINFWYSGGENWSDHIPQSGSEAEQGCVGCGWYDFETWRNALNTKTRGFEPQ